ncbi:hypothetical protein [Nonomuraea sp. MG754425]|nr:hypothetical protein [Nonomuraea sp. MG754425]
MPETKGPSRSEGHEGDLEYTLLGGWPLARDEEAVEAFQTKVAKHIHA